MKVGDRVKLGEDTGGQVVASIDTREYSAMCSETEWSFLERGEPGQELELLGRAGETPS